MMTKKPCVGWSLGPFAFLMLIGLTTQVAAADLSMTAQHLISLSETKGGFIVHLGSGDGQLTAELGKREHFTVHGLEPDLELVKQARRYLQQRGMYGRVSVEQFSGNRLPYADNLVNILIVEPSFSIDDAELMRVLVPDGMVLIRQDGEWKRHKKPRPTDIDSWSHFLHGPDNNAVAQDLTVGPPDRLQWLAPPLWLRSHETPSGIQSPVSDGQRLFYIFDEGIVGVVDKRFPDRWSLVCRDAFNGRLLWKRKLESWGWRDWAYERDANRDWTATRARRGVPKENQRRIVATDDRVFATLAYHAPLSILDATSGELLHTVHGTMGTREILVSDGVAVVYAQSPDSEYLRRRGLTSDQPPSVVAVDSKAGTVRWKVETQRIHPLSLTIHAGRVIYFEGNRVVALNLEDGNVLWRIPARHKSPRTVVASDGVIVAHNGKFLDAYASADGRSLWSNQVRPIGGAEADDLFVIDGVVWRGIEAVDDQQQPQRKSANALATGWDLHTGEVNQEIFVKNLRSPEHHHRCYRNKATPHFLISSLEGAEFLDFEDQAHCQANWIRGSCNSGMLPCNGMLYVPPDQCFCQPGAKLLGYAAIGPAGSKEATVTPNRERLKKGPAFGIALTADADSCNDWPMHRYDVARHGSTPHAVAPACSKEWRIAIGGRLTAPVVAGGKLFVASIDSHTLHVRRADNGEPLWTFTANGRIDSPPTIYRGLVFFGSCDGHVYCLRAEDGALAWRFRAAPHARRVGSFDQFESAWPVHGSVLVDRGVVYCTAGRSTYLDGGIDLFGLDPATGKVLHQGHLEGPHTNVPETRDVAFFTLGANSDLLVSEGGHLFMRQKKLTHDLKEVPVDVLSSKGAQDVGRHVFSTASLLDGSWYNRTFWMYSQRWPGFQLANQAPKSGQLLVVDESRTYAVRVFYRRNVHSPMFFPGEEGYLLFADSNENEPQIVGEPGSRPPGRWLPQSDFSRARGDEMRSLDSEAFGLDKMIGYTRAEPPLWKSWLPTRIRAMVKAGDTLFVAGAADEFDPEDPYAMFDRPKDARVVAISAQDGTQLSETALDQPPVFDGMIAAQERLFVSLCDGSVVCLSGKSRSVDGQGAVN
jgi:outer membrane protein assembly factor BamB